MKWRLFSVLREHQQDNPVERFGGLSAIYEGRAGIPVGEVRRTRKHEGGIPVHPTHWHRDNGAFVSQARQGKRAILGGHGRGDGLNIDIAYLRAGNGPPRHGIDHNAMCFGREHMFPLGDARRQAGASQQCGH